MTKMKWTCLALALGMFACGPAGKISGRVTIDGASSAGVAVFAYGPVSGATVTNAEGAFSFSGLPDGEYVVRATVRDADVEEVSASTTISNGGTAAPEPILTFKASAATVTGRVVFADGSEAGGLSVIATGPETVGTRTETNGTFTFSKIKNGAYIVSVEVRDTREGRVGIGVAADGQKDVGELRLTPVGQLKGVVTYNGMPAANVTVSVPGTSVTSMTDSVGLFSLVDVPTGNQTVVARIGAEPFSRSSNTNVAVVRGSNTDLMLTITDDAPRTGTIQGVVTFRGPRDPRNIQLTVLGTSVSGSPSANGTFALMAPVGTWEVIATAPSHPKLSLGLVTVREGEVTVLPGAMLSFYRTIWKSNGPLTSASVISSAAYDNHSWGLVSLNDSIGSRLALVHAVSGEIRILASGGFSSAIITRNGKYVGWRAANAVFVYEIASGTLSSFNENDALNYFVFSTDESTLFVLRFPTGGGNTLRRIPLVNPAAAVTFPSTGSSAEIVSQGNDRWFVRETAALPGDYRLVTPTTDLEDAFTNVSALYTAPTAWALTDCSLTCSLKVLAPTATTAAVTVSGFSVVSGGLSNFSGTSGEYPCFRVNATGVSFCVKSSDGTRYALPTNTGQIVYNAAGARMIYRYSSGANDVLREDTVPPTTTAMDIDTTTNDWDIGWLSPTRAYAMEIGGAAGSKVRLISAGVPAAVDTDTGAYTFYPAPPLLVFSQQSTSKWRAVLGDGPVRPLDIPLTFSPTISVRLLQGDSVTKYAMVSSDTVTGHVIDENLGMVKKLNEGRCTGLGLRSSAMEVCGGVRPGNGASFIFQYPNVSSLEFRDTAVNQFGFVGQQPVAIGSVGLSLDMRELLLGSLVP